MVFFSVFLRTLGFLSALLVFFIIINLLIHFNNNHQEKQFVMIDGNQDSENIIAKLNLSGPIFNIHNNSLENNFYEYINPSKVKVQLDELIKLNIKVLIINMNSPGGTVSATAELENIFNNFKKRSNIKLYFYTKDILASGGYWTATSADQIYASYGSVIGSIGVSGPSWFYYDTPISISSGIFGQSIETKEGIEFFNQKAGEGKDLFNPYRRPNKKEIMHLQNIVDNVYDDFVNKVSKSRKIDISYVKNNIGAFIFNSNKAKENFLIDDVLDYEELIALVIKDNNLDNYKIYENKKNLSLIENFLSNLNINENSNVKICNRLVNRVSVVAPLFLRNC